MQYDKIAKDDAEKKYEQAGKNGEAAAPWVPHTHGQQVSTRKLNEERRNQPPLPAAVGGWRTRL